MLDVSLSWFLARSLHFASISSRSFLSKREVQSITAIPLVSASILEATPPPNPCVSVLCQPRLSFPAVETRFLPCPWTSDSCAEASQPLPARTWVPLWPWAREGWGQLRATGGFSYRFECLSHWIPLQLCHIWSVYSSWGSSSGKCGICGGLCESTNSL